MSQQSWIPVGERFYNLGSEEIRYLKAQTGIEDDNALKAHVLQIQQKAYKEYPYPCILSFIFIRFTISQMPVYSSVLEVCRARQDAIFVEFGCCVGADIRRVVVDGWPAHRVIGSDIRQAFWDLGHELYKSTPETFPATCLIGDVLDPAFLPPANISTKAPKTPNPDFHSLTSFCPLRGHVSVIYVARFFHLFNEEKQVEIACKLASLLSHEPGSTIFGTQIGSPKRTPTSSFNSSTTLCYHSPQSWQELWEDKVFVGNSIKVNATISPVPEQFQKTSGLDEHLLTWSVVRL